MTTTPAPSTPVPSTSTPSPRTRRSRTKAALAAAAAATALLVAGCAGSSAASHDGHDDRAGAAHSAPASTTSASPSTSAAHSDVDAAFARDMVVHHEGALDMAELAVERASTPEVRALAERVRAAQQPEIDLMQGWLAAWGEDPAGGEQESQHGDQHGGHGTDPSSMGMSEQDAAALEAATGTAFDRLFLQQMTVHHEGAVEMAREEQVSGSDPQARALAQRIEADQTAEVAEMAALLAQLPA